MASVTGKTKGYKSTEFWVTLAGVAGALAGQGMGGVPEPWGTVAATALGAVYTISRAFVKFGIGKER